MGLKWKGEIDILCCRHLMCKCRLFFTCEWERLSIIYILFVLFLYFPILSDHLLLLLQRPSSRHEELKERARHLLEQARREAQTRGPQRSLSKVILLRVKWWWLRGHLPSSYFACFRECSLTYYPFLFATIVSVTHGNYVS